ncbi:hypothetical protein TRFO_40176 [Tritrichomonas foetus]|uniref:DUF3447 domain-containing protein n=1 Tax=Tritrichomonas foetus TaxID=1144522 RepID=A0A1J4J266_9EUKA|nr:hypothetical protein TRFO_40176 [Tritrichomonas foetus]|eukprot:OHS93566.1 hypothetical protein TRFO_40176 [Tritrichomonas foetus]
MAFFIRSFIKEDDVSKLQSYIVSHNVNFNMDSFCEDWPTYSLMTTSPQLIHYSAQCGSIMCFKFLLINGATLQEKFYCHHYCIGNPQLDCLHYAIAGQNIEIIRLVMQHNLHFDESHLKIAIELHNISLFDWIYDSIAQEITEQTIICCFNHLFFPSLVLSIICCFNNFFLYGLKKSFEIDWLRALEISCMNGFTRFSTILLNNKIDSIEYSLFRAFRNSIASCDLLIVKRLYKISFLEISEKIKSDLYSPLLDAIIYLNIPIIKYFLSLEEIGINNDGSGSYAYIQTPLIEAAKSNHTEIIKMLLERSDIDINKHASNRITNCFPFIIIVYNNNKELIDIFLQHPQFKLNKTELDEIMKYKDIDGKIRKKILDFYKHSKEV